VGISGITGGATLPMAMPAFRPWHERASTPGISQFTVYETVIPRDKFWISVRLARVLGYRCTYLHQAQAIGIVR